MAHTESRNGSGIVPIRAYAAPGLNSYSPGAANRTELWMGRCKMRGRRLGRHPGHRGTPPQTPVASKAAAPFLRLGFAKAL